MELPGQGQFRSNFALANVLSEPFVSLFVDFGGYVANEVTLSFKLQKYNQFSLQASISCL